MCVHRGERDPSLPDGTSRAGSRPAIRPGAWPLDCCAPVADSLPRSGRVAGLSLFFQGRLVQCAANVPPAPLDQVKLTEVLGAEFAREVLRPRLHGMIFKRLRTRGCLQSDRWHPTRVPILALKFNRAECERYGSTDGHPGGSNLRHGSPCAATRSDVPRPRKPRPPVVTGAAYP
jgi:hypothetical protein